MAKRYYKKEPIKLSTLISKEQLNIPGFKIKVKEHFLREKWIDTVGEKISNRASIDKLIGKTLYVVVESSPWMTELTYQKETLMKQINDAMGQELVTEMRFFVGKVKDSGALKKPQPKITKPHPVKDEDLKKINSIADTVKEETLRSIIKKAMVKGKGRDRF